MAKKDEEKQAVTAAAEEKEATVPYNSDNNDARLSNIESMLQLLTEQNRKLTEENAALKAEIKAAAGTEQQDDAAVQAQIDYMNEQVPVHLFKDSDRYSRDVHVYVNNTRYAIKRGETVMVPRSVAMIIKQSEKMDNATEERVRRMEEAFENQTKELYK